MPRVVFIGDLTHFYRFSNHTDISSFLFFRMKNTHTHRYTGEFLSIKRQRRFTKTRSLVALQVIESTRPTDSSTTFVFTTAWETCFHLETSCKRFYRYRSHFRSREISNSTNRMIILIPSNDFYHLIIQTPDLFVFTESFIHHSRFRSTLKKKIYRNIYIYIYMYSIFKIELTKYLLIYSKYS